MRADAPFLNTPRETRLPPGQEKQQRRSRGLAQLVIARVGACLAAMEQIVTDLPDDGADLLNVPDRKGRAPFEPASPSELLFGRPIK